METFSPGQNAKEGSLFYINAIDSDVGDFSYSQFFEREGYRNINNKTNKQKTTTPSLILVLGKKTPNLCTNWHS